VAVSAGRWAAIAVLACLALAAAYLPPQPELHPYQPPEVTGIDARLNLINRAYSRAQELTTDLRLRDSVARLIRAGGAQRPALDVVTLGLKTDEVRRGFRDAVALVWQQAGPAPGARLIVLLDVRERRAESAKYVLPAALDGRTCAVSLTREWEVAWLRVARSLPTRETNLLPWLRGALGPCLYFSAFGEPGPYIQTWLEQRGYRVANTAEWDVSPPSIRLRDERVSARELIGGELSFDALSCTDGNVGRCRTAVLSASNDGVFRRHERDPRTTGVFRRAYWPRSFAIDDRYLASLVHDMGRDRFARFWRSTQPVDSAFQSAFGQPLGEWTARWARAFMPDMPPFGPAPTPVAAVSALLLALGAVAAAGVYVTRRQIS
jgi:hypothetical protein